MLTVPLMPKKPQAPKKPTKADAIKKGAPELLAEAFSDPNLDPMLALARSKIEYLEADRAAILKMVLFASMQEEADIPKIRIVLADIVGGRRDVREFPKEFEIHPVKTEKPDSFFMPILKEALETDPRLRPIWNGPKVLPGDEK